jgi:NAD(P)-dependent dehydrogenase (short-subunit alcohol dehydrogenase family)
MKDLRGRNVLLTGAGGGLGTFIAEELALAGANLALSDLPGGDTPALAHRLAASCGGKAAVVTADLGDPDQVAELVDRAEAAIGPIDVLVNNAGIEVTSVYTGFTRDEFERVAQINLIVPMELTRRALPGMLARGRGHVVFMSSLSAKLGFPYCEPYAATTAGLNALCRSLRLEYAGMPVGFSAICPGFVSEVGIGARALNGDKLPLMLRPVSPERVARAVVDAIGRDQAEVLVTGAPTRPVLAIAAVFPKLAEQLMRSTGVARLSRGIAQRRNRI